MNDLATKASSKALNEFVLDLLENPVTNDRFTAKFSLTGENAGVVEFQHLHSIRKVPAQWEIVIENEQLFGVLKYNHNFVLIRSEAESFRQKVRDTYPIF